MNEKFNKRQTLHTNNRNMTFIMIKNLMKKKYFMRVLLLFVLSANTIVAHSQTYDYVCNEMDGVWRCDLKDLIELREDFGITFSLNGCKDHYWTVIWWIYDRRKIGKQFNTDTDADMNEHSQVIIYLENGYNFTFRECLSVREHRAYTYRIMTVDLLNGKKFMLNDSQRQEFTMSLLRKYNITKISFDGKTVNTPNMRSAETFNAMCKTLMAKTDNESVFGKENIEKSKVEDVAMNWTVKPSPSTSATTKSNMTTKKITTNTPPPAPKKKVIKYISTKDIIEKPFCCVNGTWETITIQDLFSQLKANGYSQPDKLDDSNYFSLYEMESHIHDIIIDHCYATFDENGKLKRYTACYLGRKYSKEQIQKTVEQIQDDIKIMGAVIHFERKGSDMLAYFKDKEINIDFHEVSDKLYSLDITISKDSNPINKTIYPKEFTLQELLNLPFGFIKSNNQEEILKILRTNKWKIEPSSLHIHSTEEGYSMFGIPIKRFDSFFMRGKLTSFNFHGSEPLSSNQGEKYLRVYTQLQEEFKSMGGKITTIQKKKNWKKFKAEFGDRSVEVAYNSSNEVIGYQLDIDVTVK